LTYGTPKSSVAGWGHTSTIPASLVPGTTSIVPARARIALWAADASGESIDGLVPPSRLALVVGNEGGGLSSLSRTRADRLVALPIASSTDSLNVAVAAGILLYELRADQS
jgi:tRNA G18 (ribose-2'-O)-methylase SpoU